MQRHGTVGQHTAGFGGKAIENERTGFDPETAERASPVTCARGPRAGESGARAAAAPQPPHPAAKSRREVPQGCARALASSFGRQNNVAQGGRAGGSDGDGGSPALKSGRGSHGRCHLAQPRKKKTMGRLGNRQCPQGRPAATEGIAIRVARKEITGSARRRRAPPRRFPWRDQRWAPARGREGSRRGTERGRPPRR